MNIATIVLVSMVATAMLGGCRVVEDEGGGGSVSVTNFRITSEIQGWSEVSQEGYRELNPETLESSFINGGAPIYNNNGMVEAIAQQLESADEKILNVCVMDFASEQSAGNMFSIKVTEGVPQPLTIPGFDESTAVGSGVLGGGVKAYAHFGRFYFEAEFTGYGNNGEAIDAAQLFLEFYRSIVHK